MERWPELAGILGTAGANQPDQVTYFLAVLTQLVGGADRPPSLPTASRFAGAVSNYDGNGVST
jgi:hypothetical protein